MPFFVLAQDDLPLEVRIEEGRLISGGIHTEGLYDPDDVHKIELILEEEDWFELMDGEGGGGPGGGGPGGSEGETLIGKLIFDDVLEFDSVYISIKGQTSDFQNDTEKKSFSIQLDEIIDQDLMGYDNLNLNCGFQDPSGMREVLYYDMSRGFTTALKGSFVDLYINGESWGPYSNIQQLEGRYLKEWFTNNDGTRWRAIGPDEDDGPGGGPGGGGPGGAFGTGVSTLNYNGPDSTDYNEDYTLKKTEKEDPWEDLIEVCYALNETPIDGLYEELRQIMDIDRTLWFIAQEMAFSDDDSYINKGGMDYYVYWDDFTDRLMPMEVDGNTVMLEDNIDWDPFYNEDDTDFPIMNRLLQNTELRQRYLAHFRTILENYYTEAIAHDRIDTFAEVLDQRVDDDPKKIYSYNAYLNEVEDLKDFFSERIESLQNHTEINRTGVTLSNAVMTSSAGEGVSPQPNEATQITVQVEGDIAAVMMYYGEGLDGVYDRVTMLDDGQSNDGDANDGIYGASIPGYAPGNYVRYYFEGIKDDAYATASYYPPGAEHDVFIYQVEPAVLSPEEVVINEFMADNASVVADNAGEFEDWIELYNNGVDPIDLTGYFLSDDESNVAMWQFPDGTVIAPDSYLIIWADNDEEQSTDTDLHANFKLSADGETVVLTNVAYEIVDLVAFGAQQEDISWARYPNGTGDFEFRTETFAANNNSSISSIEDLTNVGFKIYPIPTREVLNFSFTANEDFRFDLKVINSSGETVLQQSRSNASNTTLNVGQLATGTYFVVIQLENGQVETQRFVKF